jgi:hypothetical protein
MASKIKVDTLETADGTGSITLNNQFSGMTTASLPSSVVTEDASGNVGIGTSSPSELIHANGSAVSGLQLTTDTYTNGTVFKVQGDGASYIYNTENAMLRFGTNNLERMRIDSAGRVTMPDQPMCRLDGNAGNTAYTAGDTLKEFNDTLNGGMTWNSSNGRITVPVSGWYQWNFFIYGYSAGGSRTQLFHNGVRKALAHTHITASINFTNAASVVLPMSANDYIYLTTDYTGNIYMGTGHSGISGHLIG